jgi:hypothetical protein
MKNSMHGSCDIDASTLLSSWAKTASVSYFYGSGNNTAKWLSITNYNSNISLLEQNTMVYLPTTFSYGTGYYESNPVVYNSKLKEKTCSKNYQAGTSMQHQIEYARSFEKDIGVDLNSTGATTDCYGVSLNHMWLEEDVSDGSVHVGELHTTGSYGWKKPLIEIDENYVGSFRLQKDMMIDLPASKVSQSSDWLDCCFGGYADINEYDIKWSEPKVFDCNCTAQAYAGYSPAYNGTAAQFPRNYTSNPASG